jgi:hypothetical protein
MRIDKMSEFATASLEAHQLRHGRKIHRAATRQAQENDGRPGRSAWTDFTTHVQTLGSRYG